jgi:hypothetical protein
MTEDYKFTPKSAILHHCKLCDFTCSKVSDWDRHILTAKHKKNDKWITMDDVFTPKSANNLEKVHICECGLKYKYRQGLYKHKQKCNIMQQITDEISDKDLILLLIKQNTKLLEQNSEIVKNGVNNNNINNNNHTNSHNKTFNLQFFLNETCKDALNITDFVQTIKPSLEDLENTGRRGYIEGISQIILKNLTKLEHHNRPIHCSDSKREVMYIKDNNEWIKESEEKPILTKAIKVIAHENIKKISDWKALNPDCCNVDSKKNNLYLKIVSNSMSGSTKEESDKNLNKIISNVARETVIQKEG